MTSSIGIWIDKTQAYIISSEKIIKTINSNIEIRPRIDGQGKDYGRFGSQFLTHEKSNKNRLTHQKNNFLKDVVNFIKKYDRYLLFGPAQMKNELGRLLLDNNELKDRFIELKTTQKMTDNQLVAYVRDFYKN